MTKHLFKPCGGGHLSKALTCTLAAFVATMCALVFSMALVAPNAALAADAAQDTSKPVTWTGADGSEVTLSRLAGNDADQTAAAMSKAGFESCECAIIARMDDFADALGASGLAGTLDCPILLTSTNKLSDAAAEELTRLGAKTVYIIGGSGALSTQIETDLEAIGIASDRIYGEYAWDTSLECAKAIYDHGGDTTQGGIIVAASFNFQDALSMSTFAYKYNVPLLLEDNSDGAAGKLTDEAVGFIEWTLGGKDDGLAGTIWVAGGNVAVPEKTVEDVFTEKNVVRLWGDDGYDTSNQIATYMTEHKLLSAECVGIASGAQKAHGVDALAGAALIGKQGGVMLLANGNDAMEDENYTTIDAGKDSKGDASYLLANKEAVNNAYVLGGEVVAPTAFFSKVEQTLRPITPETKTLPTEGWTLSSDTLTYNGTEQKPTVTAPNSLKEGADYTLAYANNKNVGTAKVTITGMGTYVGTTTLNFTIVPRDISDGTLIFEPENVTYTGSSIHMPDSRLMLDGVNVLSFDDDGVNWKFDESSGIGGMEVGTYTVLVKGVGNYTGQAKGTWNIVGIPLDTATVSVQNPTYNGNEQEITPVVKLGDTTLEANKDYKIASDSTAKAINVSDDDYTVTIEGIGKYSGKASQTWNIQPLDITNNDAVTVELSEEDVAYDGEAHTQTATVKFGSTTLTETTDYKLTGDVTATDIANYTLTVEGVGNFTGSKTATWNIHEATNYYWLALAGVDDPSAETNIIKNQTKIDKDLKVLHGQDPEKKTAVAKEWENYMNGLSADGSTAQEVRLYTKWYGTDAGTGKNQWVEFRIIQVGEHDSDGSAVTFMATHALPTAKNMLIESSSSKNRVGWSGSLLRATMNDTSGYVMTGLADLKDHVKSIQKLQATWNADVNAWDEEASLSETADTFWLLSHNELTGLGEAWKTTYRPEGTQYDWFKNKVTNGQGTNEAVANINLTRAGTSPKSKTGDFWWLRSPYILNSSSFDGVSTTGNPYSYNNQYSTLSVVPCFAM